MDFAMQNQVLSCREAQLQMDAYLNREFRPILVEHLATCEACLDACITMGLQRPPSVYVPNHFRNRVLAQRDTVEPEAREYRWALLGVILLTVLGVGLWWAGEISGIAASMVGMLGRPMVLLAVAGSETVLALLWLRHVLIDER
jgi:hypothetical protein